MLLQGFDRLPTQRLPACTFLRSPFLADGPLSFSKRALGAHIY